MGDTAISWTARRRLRPPASLCPTVGIDLGDGRCLNTACLRCWQRGSTVNPWIGCVEKTKACAECYARAVAENRMSLDVWGKNKPRAIRVNKAVKELRRINNRARRTGQPVGVFSGSMCDIFENHPDLPGPRDIYLTEAAKMLGAGGAIDLMLLTKRPENVPTMAPWLMKAWPTRIWMGATIACDDEEDRQIALDLARLKDKVGMTTFASVEPMLGTGPRIGDWLARVDLVIIGGESGGRARPFDVDAARRMIDACDRYGTRVWFKQMGSVWARHHGGVLVKGASHGQDPYRWPTWAQRREMPEAAAEGAR